MIPAELHRALLSDGWKVDGDEYRRDGHKLTIGDGFTKQPAVGCLLLTGPNGSHEYIDIRSIGHGVRQILKMSEKVGAQCSRN